MTHKTNIMLLLRAGFLITVLAMTSGYRFRCYLACTDQTGIQNDYVEQRDKCREYAQYKIDMAMKESNNLDDRSRKSQLVTLFSQCMATNGWTVPDGRGEGAPKQAAAPQAAPAQPAAPSAAVTATNKAEEKSALLRNAECNFARQSASVSSNAAARAHACDLECAEGLRVAPNAPRPASCSGDVPDKFSKGYDQ